MSRLNGLHMKWAPVIAVAAMLAACGKTGPRPNLLIPGYASTLVFQDGFGQGLANWSVDGEASVSTTRDSTLVLSPVSDTTSAVVWARTELPDLFQIEYKVYIPDTAGTHDVYFCASRTDGVAIGEGGGLPSAGFDDILKTSLASYRVSCHCYDRFGRPVSGARLRKTPGNLLLAGAPTDPCRENRGYLIDIAVVGNRIQSFVDGVPVHDVRDRGGFGPVYQKGRLGLAVSGKPNAFRCMFKTVRVFKLTPE
jgi:hypothetical protein